MTRPLRLAFLKPEHGIAGGLEAVVAELEAIARHDGHQVQRIGIDMRPPRAEVAGLDIPRHVWDAAPEYFPYLRGIDGFDRLELRHFDVVVSTQPPSFAVDHPRHLSVFYHHHRVYYDLEEQYLAGGFAPDERIHREAGSRVRALDAPHLAAIGHVLAGSATVAERLARFNDRHDATVFHAGHIVRPLPDAGANAGTGPALCIGRLEWPKRTELAVAAAHLLRGPRLAVVGTGGREAWARDLDRRLATGELDPASPTATSYATSAVRALSHTKFEEEGSGPDEGPVSFLGRVSDDELGRLLAEAPCVVAPAYDEDYGLTAVEAMAAGTPVVVCNDGGGLAELVDDGATGLVVAPTPEAIAAAVERLCTDRDLAAALGANGRDRAAELSWERAGEQFRAGLEAVLS